MKMFEMAFPLVSPSDAKSFQEHCYEALRSPGIGAIVTFGGFVRNHHQGRGVVKLCYTVYEALAKREGARLLEEVRARFSIYDARAFHIVGELRPGDSAVWAGVAAAHRAEAFEACSWLLESIKNRLPIWKEEFFTDGSKQWVDPTQ